MCLLIRETENPILTAWTSYQAANVLNPKGQNQLMMAGYRNITLLPWQPLNLPCYCQCLRTQAQEHPCSASPGVRGREGLKAEDMWSVTAAGGKWSVQGRACHWEAQSHSPGVCTKGRNDSTGEGTGNGGRKDFHILYLLQVYHLRGRCPWPAPEREDAQMLTARQSGCYRLYSKQAAVYTTEDTRRDSEATRGMAKPTWLREGRTERKNPSALGNLTCLQQGSLRAPRETQGA